MPFEFCIITLSRIHTNRTQKYGFELDDRVYWRIPMDFEAQSYTRKPWEIFPFYPGVEEHHLTRLSQIGRCAILFASTLDMREVIIAFALKITVESSLFGDATKLLASASATFDISTYICWWQSIGRKWPTREAISLTTPDNIITEPFEKY